MQNQFSPAFRSSEPELRLCAELGIAFLPWGPLGGHRGRRSVGSRFSAFAEVAEAHGVSPQQVCLAWKLALSPVVIPIPGSSRPETIEDSVRAATSASPTTRWRGSRGLSGRAVVGYSSCGAEPAPPS